MFEVGETSGPPRRRAPAGAAKTFRHYDQAQSFLLPPSLDDWLPEAHEARFISEVVEELLDLSVIYDSYVMADGAPPYAPRMMLKLLRSRIRRGRGASSNVVSISGSLGFGEFCPVSRSVIESTRHRRNIRETRLRSRHNWLVPYPQVVEANVYRPAECLNVSPDPTTLRMAGLFASRRSLFDCVRCSNGHAL
ncbi:MAG: transposase [Acidimicrobiales bacterium]